MKFVCDRCQTRYSIADEKVRQKILRIRCKTCGNVVVVQDARPGHSGGDAARDGGAKALPSSASGPAPSGAPWHAPLRPSSAPKAALAGAPRPAAPGPPPLPPPTAEPGSDPLGGHVEWYLAIGGIRSGPFSRAEAARRTMATNPGRTVHVWKEGMPGWKHADEVSVIARELSILRPPPPPPPSPPPEPLMARPASPKVAAMPSAAAKSAKAAQAPSSAPLFPGKPHTPPPASIAAALEIAVEMGSEAFAEGATKKVKSIPGLSKEPGKGSLADITTEKGKNLHALDDDPLFASVPALSKPDRPPLAAQPQPAVGAKVTPSASSLDMETLGGFPNLSASQPDLSGVSEVIRAVEASDPPSSPELAFPAPIALSAPETPFPEQLSPASGFLSGKRAGVKYLVAAGAIVVLVILIVLVTLRMDSRKVPDIVPTPSSIREPEPVPEPKLADVEPPKPMPLAEEKPAPAPAPAPAPHGKGKHGLGRTSRRMDVGPAPSRQPDPKPAAKPTLAVRPNPFDETKAVSQSQISAVVRNRANQDGLRSCYERALKMDTHLTSGRIDVTVSIGTSGLVQRVVINAPASFILVESCIKNAVKRWVFPPSSEEYGTNFPLIMQGGM